MHISDKPLWHTLIERNMRKEDLRLAAGLTTNMIANMGKEGKHISMDTLARICETLDCGITDVIELVSDEPSTTGGNDNGKAERITENGIDYILAGDYYIPDLKLPEENRSIGRYGRLHREYLKQEYLARYSSLILTGKLWTYLADLNEQAEERLDLIIENLCPALNLPEVSCADIAKFREPFRRESPVFPHHVDTFA